jgi:hypothetical protein
MIWARVIFGLRLIMVWTDGPVWINRITIKKPESGSPFGFPELLLRWDPCMVTVALYRYSVWIMPRKNF